MSSVTDGQEQAHNRVNLLQPVAWKVGSPRVRVILNGESLPATLASVLRRSGASVSIRRFGDRDSIGTDFDADAVVVLAPDDRASARRRIENLLAKLARRPCGTLVITQTPLNGLARLACPPHVPVSFAVQPTEEELAARLTTICAYGRPLRRIAERADHAIRQGRQLADQANHRDEQLELASQVQRGFLPQAVPECEGVRFLTLYKPADYVSGDIYDLTRLDETHVGVSIADVSGHGVPAALLTLFVKHAFRLKQIEGNSYRILPPDEVLRRLNQDILAADFQQCQFVTACHALYDGRQRVVTWARGGSPYPILVRPGQTARQIRTAGDLIGAFGHAHFEVRSQPVRPGDTLLFFTDGLETLLLLGNPQRRLDHITQTEWFARLGTGPIDDHIAEIDRLLHQAADRAWPRDDVTLVALCVENGPTG